MNGPKPVALDGLARRQRQRAQRAAVEAAEERDDVRAARRVARQLDARFDGFGAGVAEERPHAALPSSGASAASSSASRTCGS